MTISTALRVCEISENDFEILLPVARQIERFLSGRSDGRVLLERLYGGVEDEPVPQRLLDIARRAR